MSTLIEVPLRLDESTFDAVAAGYAASEGAAKVIVDAHACE